MYILCALYRTGWLLITSLSFLFIVSAAQATPVTAPVGNPFAVENVTVDETADNAVTARTQAMSTAQSAAWDRLVKNLEAQGEPLAYLQKPDPLTIGGLVETMEVNDEQTTATRYLANIDVTFSETAIRHYLARMGVHLSIAPQARPTLLLPWYRDIRGQMHFWGEGNHWFPIWADKSGRTDPPVRIPAGDIKDTENITAERPENLAPHQVRQLLDRYDLDQAVMAVARQETPQRLSLSVFKMTATGRVPIGEETLNAADPNQDEAILLHQALTRTLVLLRGNTSPADTNITDTTQPGLPTSRDYPMIARANDLNEWIGMKKRLDQAFGAQNIQITALTPGRIELVLTGPDLYSDFASKLGLYGLEADANVAPNQPLILRQAHRNRF